MDFGNYNGGGGQRGRGEEQREPEPYDTSGNGEEGGVLGKVKGVFSGIGGSRRSSGGSSGGGNGGGSWGKALIAVGIIGFLLWLVFGGFRGNGFISFQRIAGMPMENTDKMLSSVAELNTVNKKSGDFDEIYDKNALYDDSKYLSMPEKEYLVYIYSGDKKKDKVFNDFVKENQKEIPTYKYKFTAVNYEPVKNIIEGTVKPYILVIVDYGKSNKKVHAVIDKEAQVSNLKGYFEDVVSKNYFKQNEVNYKISEESIKSNNANAKFNSTDVGTGDESKEGNSKKGNSVSDVEEKGLKNKEEESSKESQPSTTLDEEMNKNTEKALNHKTSQDDSISQSAKEYQELQDRIKKAEEEKNNNGK